jgi:hypothetical protein
MKVLSPPQEVPHLSQAPLGQAATTPPLGAAEPGSEVPVPRRAGAWDRSVRGGPGLLLMVRAPRGVSKGDQDATSSEGAHGTGLVWIMMPAGR